MRTPLSRFRLLILVLGLMGMGVAPAAAAAPPAPPLPDSTALDSALVQVDDLRREGQFRDALARINTLRETHGDEVELLWRASLTRVDLGKVSDGAVTEQHYQEALKLAEAALTVDDSDPHAHLAKAVAEGRIALDAGTKERVQRSRKVKEHADRALELDSTLAAAYHVRGRWNREVSDLNFIERTIVKTVYGGLPEASFEQAVRDFQQAIALENVRFHHLELGKTYLKMDREDDARAQFRTVLERPQKEYFGDRYRQEAEALLDDLR
jgi:tetratricopeptide (TPR) repeat protein